MNDINLINSVYIVILIIFVGLGIYLFSIDKKISKLEKKFKDLVKENDAEINNTKTL